ncbi:hypothetical protein F3Y22_tig00110597pilonHSYRG00156 [Hibiscus syriacus]|uniref:Conserved oligomeric Golgi complex subunit 8 n=1 Tax=Hibiscus syriacus TaxID=106335 RepID=A0A6A3A304_HIBSY|nr:hypothetical protein F3Y22_tig00110597pilonHSYRG00156 [Hibiscus syriacus]
MCRGVQEQRTLGRRSRGKREKMIFSPLEQRIKKYLRKAVSDSLLRYNATRMLRENESGLFFSLCLAFIEVVFPHCATCFGRCYPGGASLIMDAKSLHDGVACCGGNGGETSVENVDGKEQESPTSHTDEKIGEAS